MSVYTKGIVIQPINFVLGNARQSVPCMRDSQRIFSVSKIATAIGRLTLFNLTMNNVTISDANLTRILSEQAVTYHHFKNETERGLFNLFKENHVDVISVVVISMEVGSLVINYKVTFDLTMNLSMTPEQLNPIKGPTNIYTSSSTFHADTSSEYSYILGMFVLDFFYLFTFR